MGYVDDCDSGAMEVKEQLQWVEARAWGGYSIEGEWKLLEGHYEECSIELQWCKRTL